MCNLLLWFQIAYQSSKNQLKKLPFCLENLRVDLLVVFSLHPFVTLKNDLTREIRFAISCSTHKNNC
jgi:hypothetical protein